MIILGEKGDTADREKNDEDKVHKRLSKMTTEMTAEYSMIIWLVEMTAEMTAGSIELII